MYKDSIRDLFTHGYEGGHHPQQFLTEALSMRTPLGFNYNLEVEYSHWNNDEKEGLDWTYDV